MRSNEADVLTHLGDAPMLAGDGDAARVAWRSALEIFTKLGHPKAQKVVTKLRGT